MGKDAVGTPHKLHRLAPVSTFVISSCATQIFSECLVLSDDWIRLLIRLNSSEIEKDAAAIVEEEDNQLKCMRFDWLDLCLEF